MSQGFVDSLNDLERWCDNVDGSHSRGQMGTVSGSKSFGSCEFDSGSVEITSLDGKEVRGASVTINSDSVLSSKIHQNVEDVYTSGKDKTLYFSYGDNVDPYKFKARE